MLLDAVGKIATWQNFVKMHIVLEVITMHFEYMKKITKRVFLYPLAMFCYLWWPVMPVKWSGWNIPKLKYNACKDPFQKLDMLRKKKKSVCDTYTYKHSHA